MEGAAGQQIMCLIFCVSEIVSEINEKLLVVQVMGFLNQQDRAGLAKLKSWGNGFTTEGNK